MLLPLLPLQLWVAGWPQVVQYPRWQKQYRTSEKSKTVKKTYDFGQSSKH